MNYGLQLQYPRHAAVFKEHTKQQEQRAQDDEKDQEAHYFAHVPFPRSLVITQFREDVLFQALAGTRLIGEEVKLGVARNVRMLLKEHSQLGIVSGHIFLVAQQRWIAAQDGRELGAQP